MLKKVLLGLMLIILFFALFGGVTGFQLVPFIILYVLAYFNEKEKRDFRFWIVLLALLMVVINLQFPSVADVVIWALIAIAWWK